MRRPPFCRDPGPMASWAPPPLQKKKKSGPVFMYECVISYCVTRLVFATFPEVDVQIRRRAHTASCGRRARRIGKNPASTGGEWTASRHPDARDSAGRRHERDRQSALPICSLTRTFFLLVSLGGKKYRYFYGNGFTLPLFFQMLAAFETSV